MSSSESPVKIAKTKGHPSFPAMIEASIKYLNDKKGSSKKAIEKYMIAR